LALFHGFWKGLSSTLDYVPLVGGVKNTIEACVGYSMTGEKLTTGERLLLGGLGVASTIIDVFTFGFGTGLIQGGKVVGKEVAKGMVKQVGKYAVMDITASVALGWTSQYASEKLRDMGLSSEEIFMVHLVASLSVMGYSKYKTNKVNINASAYHAVDEGWKAQSVLDGIDISYTSPDSRFGQGFYVAAEGDTTIAELAYHGADAKYAIRYDIDLTGQNVLDLTSSDIAAKWRYSQGNSSLLECQKIAEQALDKGYNVIKVQSYRSDGINYIIYDNFDEILSPQMVTPVK